MSCNKSNIFTFNQNFSFVNNVCFEIFVIKVTTPLLLLQQHKRVLEFSLLCYTFLLCCFFRISILIVKLRLSFIVLVLNILKIYVILESIYEIVRKYFSDICSDILAERWIKPDKFTLLFGFTFTFLFAGNIFYRDFKSTYT